MRGPARLARALAEPPTPPPAPGPVHDPPPMPGPLVLELLAAVLESGAPPAAAVQAVAAALGPDDARAAELRLLAGRVRAGPDLSRDPTRPAARIAADVPTAGDGRWLVSLEGELGLAARSGLAPAGLVRRAAGEERRRSVAAQVRAARRLEVLLVVPAGLCLLPAFVLLGIVPLVLDLITG